MTTGSDRRPELFAEFRGITAEICEDLEPLGKKLSHHHWCELAVEQVVLQQLRHLRSYLEIRRRIAEDDLLLHGWMYDELTGKVDQVDPRTGQVCP